MCKFTVSPCFNVNFDHDHKLQGFLRNNCAGYNLEDLQNEIENMDIKNIIKNTYLKIPKFNLKLYAFLSMTN